MAGTVTSGLSFFSGATGGTSHCDTVTDWSSGVVDTEIFVQGTGALSAKVSKATVTSVFSLASALDLSSTQLFVWMMCASIGVLDTKANGGVRIRVEDGSANWGEWYVAGKDTWTGSWDPFMVHTTTSFDSNSATSPTMTAITKVGVVCTTTGPVAKNNFWWDALRYGEGLYIKAGTEASPATFADFVTAEENVSNMWGVITEVEGIVLCQSKLFFGSTTAGEATYFKDLNKVVVFRDRPVPADFYGMTVQGNGTANTQVFFGSEVGGRGISGCAFRSVGTPKFSLTATDTNITDLGIYGCSFYDVGTISLPVYSATRKVLNSSFEACAEVLADTCTVQYCNFISADGRGIRMSSTSHNITDCNFISCPDGVHIPNTGTYTFNALKFSGNTFDIENSSAGLVTVNCTNGADASTYENTGGGTTQIFNTKTLKVTALDSSNNPIEDAQVWIQKRPDDTDYGHSGNPFTSAAGNNQGDGDFVVTETPPTDLPSSGWLAVQDVTGLVAKEHPYRYASKSGSTFTFPATVTGTDDGTGNETTINETGIGAKNIVEGDTIRKTAAPLAWAVVLSVSANSVTTTPLSGGASWASATYSVHTLAVDYESGVDKATVPLMNEETNASGIATEDYNYGGVKDVVVRVRRSSALEPQYLPLSTQQQITADGLILIVTLAEDTIR